jgi:two-component system, chemotaxis family, sensor kinase Cph1
MADFGSLSFSVRNKVTAGDLPAEVIGDRGQLVQLFQNLISNAIKFRSSGPPQIFISGEEKQHDWYFEIKDNGIGISAQYLERIFVIFQRLNNQEYQGSGIGLSICKRIVEAHRGQIGVASEVGRGSRFWFTLAKTPS